MDGVGGLLRGLGGDNQRISDRVACTESLGVVHALDMNREAVSINERHGARALHNLVLKASPPNRVVLCIGTLAACEARVGCTEVDLRAAVPSELADRRSHECQRDGEAVPFRFRSKRGRQWESVSMALVPCDLTARDEDGSLLSDAEIRGNTLTALLAGEDTTANTLAWSLHLLSHNPAAQERLQAEADAVVGRARCARSMAQLATLPWCDAVMAESLRLKPVAPMFFKTALKDTRIGDLDIPRGTHLILDMRHGADQDARYDQPAQFDPARWLADDAPRFEAASPMPFGAGPRICPGRNLAQLEVRSVLSMIGRSFELHTVAPEDSVTERFGFTMAPAGLRLKLTARAQAGYSTRAIGADS